MPRDFAAIARQVKDQRREQSDRLQSLKAAALSGVKAAREAHEAAKTGEAALQSMADLKYIPGFYPTPPAVIARMFEAAEIGPTHTILEPSAGRGDIAEAIRRQYPANALVCVEINSRLREILQRKGFHLVGDDFMAFDRGDFGRILMNPPFEKEQDAQHILRAFELLKPGGRLVAICGAGVLFRSSGPASQLRELVDANGYSERLPEGAFRMSDRPVGVNTVLVVLDKD